MEGSGGLMVLAPKLHCIIKNKDSAGLTIQ